MKVSIKDQPLPPKNKMKPKVTKKPLTAKLQPPVKQKSKIFENIERKSTMHRPSNSKISSVPYSQNTQKAKVKNDRFSSKYKSITTQVLITDPPLKMTSDQLKNQESTKNQDTTLEIRETEQTDYSCEDSKAIPYLQSKKRSKCFYTNLSLFATSQPSSAMIRQTTYVKGKQS